MSEELVTSKDRLLELQGLLDDALTSETIVDQLANKNMALEEVRYSEQAFATDRTDYPLRKLKSLKKQ